MENQTANQLLPAFYKQYNLPADGGQNDSYVKVEMNDKIHFYIPNFDARRRAVLKHDVHHIITGYPSELKGEAEIAAWEIASGCSNYWAALLINSQGLLMGCAFYPLSTFKAFKKGRRTSNLYKNQFSEEEFLNMKVSELKKHLKLTDYDEKQKTTISDLFSFIGWILFCVVIAIFSLVLMPFFILYNLKLSITGLPS